MTGISFSNLRLLSHSFIRGIIGRIVLQSFFITLLIESIFLAEKFPAIFNKGVENHVPLADIFMLLLLASPEIFDIALAVAILISVYRALLRAREDRELLVMSCAGMGIIQLIGLLLAVSLLGQITSLTVSGGLAPAATYTQRLVLFNAQYHALREGGGTGQFYDFPNHVVFAGRNMEDGAGRRLFIKQTMGNTERIITADKASLDGPDSSGQMALKLRDFLAYDFEVEAAGENSAPRLLCPGCPAIPEGAPSVSMRVRNFTQQFQLDELLRFAPRGSDNVGEWNLFELLGVLPPPAPLGQAETKSLGERLARSMLCLLAPLVAGLAIAFTTRGTQVFALPLACAALLGLNVLASVLVGILTPFGNDSVLQAMCVIVAILFTALIVAMVRTQRALVRPGLGRP